MDRRTGWDLLKEYDTHTPAWEGFGLTRKSECNVSFFRVGIGAGSSGGRPQSSAHVSPEYIPPFRPPKMTIRSCAGSMMAELVNNFGPGGESYVETSCQLLVSKEKPHTSLI